MNITVPLKNPENVALSLRNFIYTYVTCSLTVILLILTTTHIESY